MAAVARPPQQASLRRARRGRVTAAALAVLTLLSGVASAQTAPPPNLKSRFQETDKNHDGLIDREEYFRAAVESFYFRDKDRKGYLTIEELREASPEAFKAANRKGDGRLSLQEYVNALFIDFDKADIDGNGGLSYEEIDAYVRGTRK